MRACVSACDFQSISTNRLINSICNNELKPVILACTINARQQRIPVNLTTSFCISFYVRRKAQLIVTFYLFKMVCKISRSFGKFYHYTCHLYFFSNYYSLKNKVYANGEYVENIFNLNFIPIRGYPFILRYICYCFTITCAKETHEKSSDFRQNGKHDFIDVGVLRQQLIY